MKTAMFIFAAALSFGETGHAATLTFDSAPEITFDIPTGWSACDPATLAELQGPPPKGELKTLCKGFDDKGGARMVGSPNGLLALSFTVVESDTFPVSTVSPSMISERSAGICQSVLHVSPRDGDCVVELGKVANRPALVGRARPHGWRYDLGRVIVVLGDQRSAVFIFLSLSPTADTNSGMEAIIASIRVSASAAPR